jgi:uncharacterized membrane protein
MAFRCDGVEKLVWQAGGGGTLPQCRKWGCMFLLSLGMVVFVGIHLVPTVSSLRQSLVQRLGEDRYRGIFSAIALFGLMLIILGKAQAAFAFLWHPPGWGRHVAPVLMPLAFILLAAEYMPSNLKRLTRHPMLWGVTVWSVAHLLANGDLASLVLFGGLGAFSLFDMWSKNRRGATKSNTAYPPTKDAMVLGVGFVAFGLVAIFHPYLFGVPALSW